MDLHRLSISMLVVVTVLLVGCSSSSKELSTPDQAVSFITSVAHGGAVGDWQLASNPSKAAKRAWAERDALYDLGVILRREGSVWACEYAESAAKLSTLGVFSRGDREALASTAKALGAKEAEINKLLDDVLKLSVPDLIKATLAVCPYASQ